MKIPDDAIIDPRKLTEYLLKYRDPDDKSQYLLQAGFEPTCAWLLESAIRDVARSVETVADRTNDYGDLFAQHGTLKGPNGRLLPVTIVWIRWRIDASVHFVTLKPRREVSL